MIIRTGRHAGWPVEAFLLRDPRQLLALLNHPDQPEGESLQEEVRRLLEIFDRKPFLETCQSRHGCNRRAERFSIYRRTASPMFWCGECNPYSKGACPNTLIIGARYMDAINAVRDYGSGTRREYRQAAQELAVAKGAPPRINNEKAIAFFGGAITVGN